MLLSADTASASLGPLGRTFRGGRFGGDAHRKRFFQRLFNRKSGDGEVRVKTGSIAVRDKQCHRRVVEVGVGKGVVVLILRVIENVELKLIKKDPLPFLNEKGSIEYWPKVQSIIKTVADDRDPRTLVDLKQPIYALEGDVLKIICNNN